MIIKSMPRKDASFGQLIAYITDDGKADSDYFYGHNTFSNDPGDALLVIQDNAIHLKARKNGNSMYHEILSITREDGMQLPEQKAALRNITARYIEQRAPNSVAFAAIHDDHEGHIHSHIMLSANELGSSKKVRITR